MARRILILGTGGREDALGWKLAQEGHEIYIAPGNGGTSRFGIQVAINALNFEKIAECARRERIDLIVVASDDPLAAGAVDYFTAHGVRAFGPTRAAAQIEASKIFAKMLMVREGIPTAPFASFETYGDALEHVNRRPAPMVVKKNGLALGKGSYPCMMREKARIALHNIMLSKKHGPNDNEVVVEDFLPGEEMSLHALCDGRDALMFPRSQDHKRLHDGDVGEMTGGMGVVAPVTGLVTDDHVSRLIAATLGGLAQRDAPFKGLLYPGLMISPDGRFNVLEFNARFGDSECQAYMRLLKSDLLPLLDACIDGTISSVPSPLWHQGFVACVTLVSGGYPGKYLPDFPIEGIDEAEKIPGVLVFHAGTSWSDILGRYITSGGRVLNVTALGDTLQDAIDRAYHAVSCLKFEAMYYRRDIGQKALAALR